MFRNFENQTDGKPPKAMAKGHDDCENDSQAQLKHLTTLDIKNNSSITHFTSSVMKERLPGAELPKITKLGRCYKTSQYILVLDINTHLDTIKNNKPNSKTILHKS